MDQSYVLMKQRVEEHFATLDVLKHNIDGIINIGRQAENNKGKAVECYRLEAEKLNVILTKHKEDIMELYVPICEGMELLRAGVAVPKDFEAFRAKIMDLFNVLDQAQEIDRKVMKLASDLQADPLLAGDVSATYSLPNGITQMPVGSVTSFKLALSKRNRVTLTDPMEIIDFVSQKASSSPVKKIQRDFGMSVINAATGNLNRPVKTAATFTPGKAKVSGSSEYSFGYLWEMSAIPSESQDPADMLTSYCFMTVNDRDLFSRCYCNGQNAPVNLTYSDFIPDEEMGTNFH